MASAVWQHTFTHLLDNDFKLWCAGDDAPSLSEVAALEGRLGFKLPKQYTDFLTRYGGVMLEVHERVWPRPLSFKLFNLVDLVTTLCVVTGLRTLRVLAVRLVTPVGSEYHLLRSKRKRRRAAEEALRRRAS